MDNRERARARDENFKAVRVRKLEMLGDSNVKIEGQ